MTSGCFEPATIITSTALKSMINGMGRTGKAPKTKIKLQRNPKPQTPDPDIRAAPQALLG
jgi:hypothetical protein